MTESRRQAGSGSRSPALPLYFLGHKVHSCCVMQGEKIAAFECRDSGMRPAWMELSVGWLSWLAAPGINWCQDSRSECGKFWL